MVATNESAPHSAGLVRTSLALADARRRTRETRRQLWRVAPLVAAVSFCAAGGAVFTQAYYPSASTETAQGHALTISGQPRSVSGMVRDVWYDRQTRTTITAGQSLNHNLLDGSPRGGSPEQLLVHTLGLQAEF